MEIVQTIGVLPTNIYFYTLEVELDSIENVNDQKPYMVATTHFDLILLLHFQK